MNDISMAINNPYKTKYWFKLPTAWKYEYGSV